MSNTAPPTPTSATGARGGWTVMRIAGVPIRVDASWFIIAALIGLSLLERFNRALPDHSFAVVVLAAVATTALFFASLLGHELGHALMSLRLGIPVRSITLFLLGGVTESLREARRAWDEFLLVGIGPAVSLGLAGVFYLAYRVVAVPYPSAIEALFGYLAWVNALLGVFNLVPGYPLDGGRLLRSILWGATGRPHAATRWAARVGQAFALALIGFGVWLSARGGGSLGGLWEIVLGASLLRGASEAHRGARTRERIGTVTAAQVMGTPPPVLDPNESLASAIARVQERPSLLWPVGTPLEGALTLAQIDVVPADAWATTRVADVALTVEDVTVDAALPLDEAALRLGQSPVRMLLVTRDGRAVGLLTPSLVEPLL